ncbi:MAG: hypothetical protein Q9161_004916 [Pseudevernia consocians]
MRFAFRNNPAWSKHKKIISQPKMIMNPSHNDQAPSGPYTADKYTRRADHTANTAQEEEDNYILALHTDPEHHKRVTALRSQYFPPKLNKLSAHIALFRALPGSQLATIEADVSAAAEKQRSFSIATDKAYLLGHGVAIDANAPPAKDIYNGLKDKWEDFLSKQDKSFKAHYTIQNKVEDGVPQRTLEELQKNFEGSRGQVDGLSLYRYDRGYWRHTKDFMFPR